MPDYRDQDPVVLSLRIISFLTPFLGHMLINLRLGPYILEYLARYLVRLCGAGNIR